MILNDILNKSADLFPEKIAIIHKKSLTSYDALSKKSNSLANFLIGSGLKKGDRVGLLLQKSPEAIISFLGVAKAGGVIFPVDFNQMLNQIQYVLELTRPVALIVSADFEPLLSKLKLNDAGIKIIMVGEVAKNSYYSWEEIISQKAGNVSGPIIDPDDPVYLNFTSGTTGVPKGAITTHANIYWNTKSAIESLGLTQEDIHLCGFPVFSHPHELFARALYLGGTVVLTDDVLPKTIATAILEHKVTCMMAMALIYENMVRYNVSPLDVASLRIAESGGMYVSPTLAENFKERFNISIIPVWGSTETSGIALAMPIQGEYRLGSMGKPCPYYEVKVVSDAGEELGTDEVGEMLVRGAGVCAEYFKNPEETKKTMRDGWLLTGDLVRKDSNSYFHFISRKTGMIKVAGLRVYPKEIEDVLITHPAVAEVAVVKIQDEALGEVPKAFVALKKDAEISADALRSFCAKKLAKYKVPAIIEFLTELPKTPGGKVSYQKLQLAA